MYIKGIVRNCALLLSISLFVSTALAEGSLQAGLNQPLVEYGATVAGHAHREPLHVDILRAGEIINISLCGSEFKDDVAAEVYDPDGKQVARFRHDHGNVSCDNPLSTPLPEGGPWGDQGPFRYVAPSAGTYAIRLFNLGGEHDEDEHKLIRRFDITVTADAAALPDPSAPQGRLWSREWGFWTQSFKRRAATDADYFILVPGGRANTHYVWKLDLNRFSGAWYTLVANGVGVAPPRSGYSVPEEGNRALPGYPIYMSYPAVAGPRPDQPPVVERFLFMDDAGQDFAISPGATAGVQDKGVFSFQSDVHGTYAIVIDTNRDGIFGAGDRLLMGTARPGRNEAVWDGRGPGGSRLAPGVYDAELRVSLGEYHFVARDVETSGGDQDGLTIYLASADGSIRDTRVYWDDATLLSDPAGGTTLPDGRLSSTAAGHHTWGDFTGRGIGNERYIDTYVYGLSVRSTTQAAIVTDDALMKGNDGGIAFAGTPGPGEELRITVTDPDLDSNPSIAQRVAVQVVNDDTGEREQVLLIETAPHSGVFSGALASRAAASAGINNDGVLNMARGQTLRGVYIDQLDSGGGTNIPRVALLGMAGDSDGDGISDDRDLDSDNDGIPDGIEGSGDSDGDGVPDYRDLDSDNDGLFDLIEAGIADASTLDADGDGRIDGDRPVGRNGLADVVETGPDSGGIRYTIADTDGDGVKDFRDLDSDNDGLYDLTEAGGRDADHDGILGTGTPTVDAAGLAPGAGLRAVDTDGDGVTDPRDRDADGDGLYDVREAGGSDPDNDGVLGSGVPGVGGTGLVTGAGLQPPDSDGDGRPDYLDLDSDADGTPDADDAFPTDSGETRDSDGDGVGDNGDLDDDNDGIPDLKEGNGARDTDGDGIADALDRDSDGDGIDDLAEAGGKDRDGDGRVDDFVDANRDGLDDRLAATPLPLTDSDNDGTPDYLDNADSDGDGVLNSLDADDDNDGIPDRNEGDAGVDTDGDGIPDLRDLDSDNDGISDLIESGVDDPRRLDGDGNGRIDTAFPVGGNGLADAVEAGQETGKADHDGDGRADAPRDSDHDGIPDYRDPDADNDGLTDITEAGGPALDGDGDGRLDAFSDANGDGFDDTLTLTPLPGIFADSDRDGVFDFRDNDDGDGDGVSDAQDLDADNDGIPDSLEGKGLVDSDGDGVPDSRDLDSDNDGLFDLIEAGIADASTLDADGDGRIDGDRPVGHNGLADAVETGPDSGGIDYTLADTDGDGRADFRDRDSDNDGIPDVTEAGGNDPDGDGIPGSGPRAADDNGLVPGAGLRPADTDGDGLPDFRDLDSDGDGGRDIVEAGGVDADGDGRVDGFADADRDGLDDATARRPLPLPDSDGDDVPDYRDNDDNDSDGVLDASDLDDDNDGIPDSIEGTADSDGDGVPDYHDLDSDNDGLLDLAESGIADPSRLDADSDGRIDSAFTVGTNGLADVVETGPDSGSVAYTVSNADGDALDDYRDRDSDGDGIPDTVEGGHDDPDGDGRVGSGDPRVNVHGVAQASVRAPDSDGDGVPDYRDLDSDNDGIGDVVEAGGRDGDGDGRLDGTRDGDGNGLDDGVQAAPLPRYDTDGDGTPDYLDLDSDNDGVSDLVESGAIDRDRDGRVDDLRDGNRDGLHDGRAGHAPDLPDRNGNGIPDYRDGATAESPREIRTGLRGVGGCTLSPGAAFDPLLPLLLLIFLSLLWRRRTDRA